MLIFGNFFKTQSDQNIPQNAQNAPSFLKKIWGASIYPLTALAYACNTHATRMPNFNQYYYFYMKIAILFSRIFHNTH